MKDFDAIVLPPGSDNINAFLFASISAKFIQLIPTNFSAMLENPFFSFAGLRYMLPFMERIIFVEPSSLSPHTAMYSGSWNIRDIDKAIESSLHSY